MLLVKLAILVQVVCTVLLGNEATVNLEAVEQRIHRGIPTTEEQFPFIALIQTVYYDSTIQKYYRGTSTGFIISPQWIMTAAHCLGKPYYFNKFMKSKDHKYINYTTSYEIITDLIEVNGLHPNNLETASVISSKNAYPHPQGFDYNGGDPRHPVDLALLKLDKPLSMTDLTKSIPLLSSKFPNDVKYCIALGFGRTHPVEDIDKIRTLNYINVTAGDSGYCIKVFGDGGLGDRSICVKGVDKFSSPCPGDSGSPLVCKGTDERYFAAGVLSGGVYRHGNRDICGLEVKVTIYESIFYAKEWIVNVTQGVTFVSWN